MSQTILPKNYGWLAVISVILTWAASTAAIYFMWNNFGIADIFQLPHIDSIGAIKLQIFIVIVRSGVKISLFPNKYKFV